MTSRPYQQFNKNFAYVLINLFSGDDIPFRVEEKNRIVFHPRDESLEMLFTLAQLNAMVAARYGVRCRGILRHNTRLQMTNRVLCTKLKVNYDRKARTRNGDFGQVRPGLNHERAALGQDRSAFAELRLTCGLLRKDAIRFRVLCRVEDQRTIGVDT